MGEGGGGKLGNGKLKPSGNDPVFYTLPIEGSYSSIPLAQLIVK